MTSQKLTVEELEQRIKELEKETDKRKAAKRALRDSERRFRELADLLPISIFEMDDSGKLTYANRGAFNQFGYTQEDLNQGLNGLDMISPEDRKKAMASIQRIVKGEQLGSQEYLALRKDGSTFPGLVNSTTITRAGKHVGLRGFIVDVTKLKQTEKALRESEEKYRHLSEGAFEAIVWHDEGKIIEANEQYYTMFGYKPEELTGKNAILLTASPKSAKLMRKQIAFGDLGPYEVVCTKKDGTVFPAEIRAKKMQFKGKMVRLAAIRDLTDRKQGEKALKRKEKELKNKARDLNEVNSALKVLLKRTEQDKKELKERVVVNIKELILPYIQKLEKTKLDNRQLTFLKILRSNLDGIVSPFLGQLSSKYIGLTPNEIQVASFVKQGKTTKEIAELSNSSVGAINFHRNNLRKKLGLRNRKVNLRSYLLSLS